MSVAQIKALNLVEEKVNISEKDLESLKHNIQGSVIIPGDANYHEQRKIWNDMIDRKPAFIIQCLSSSDIMEAINFAKQHDLLISVRGAGHNIAGRALKDDVMLIDLSLMKNVKVDPVNKTALVEPGATLGDIDAATQAHGLALPIGINSTTGISGLTLGGGFGWLTRKYGMTVDNLKSVEIITTNGKKLKCDKNTNADLFWAIRGGGGNFGIVSQFEFQLHAVGPQVMAGPLIFSIDEAKSVFQKYRNFCKNMPRELSTVVVIRKAPPFPFLDSSYHGKPVLIIAAMYCGSLEEGEKEMEKLRGLGTPIGDATGQFLFTEFQQMFDPLLAPGARNYWKTHNFIEIPDELVDTFIESAKNLPSMSSEIFLVKMGGVVNDVDKNATAYPHRDVEFIMNVHTRWEEEKQDEECINWGRKFYDQTRPFATGGSYVNFVSEGDDNLQSSYGENIERLKEIKEKYDPKNILRANLNISPA